MGRHAPAFGPEVLHRLLRREKQPQDVRVELPVKLGLRDRLKRVELIDPGVIHEHVQGAEGLLRFREQPLHISRPRYVALDHDRRAAR